MDTLTIIITLVSLVAGVFQIILFFKVWGMCNDVRALRQQQCPEMPAQGNKNNGYSGLLIAFFMVIIIIALICIVLAL